MNHKLDKSILDRFLAEVVQKKYIYGSVFYVSSESDSIDLISASGNIQEDSPYYIASINKLFVSAVVLKLCAEYKLALHDKISKFLPEDVIRGLHRFKGRDYSEELSIAHLISQTSGLPCYLTDRQANGKIAMKELEAGIDQAWPIGRVIREIKKMEAHFPPGEKGRAKYGDTNHQILGMIIQNVTGEPVHSVLNGLFQALHLRKTYVYDASSDVNYIPIRYKAHEIHLPLFLASTQNDIISTARDQMTFLKAFFNGYFFPKEKLNELEKWNNIFFPFQYGIGMQKFRLPRYLSPFHPVPEMVGHCGSTGSVAFYVPDLGLYITGTVNQQAKSNIAFQTMIKIVEKS